MSLSWQNETANYVLCPFPVPSANPSLAPRKSQDLEGWKDQMTSRGSQGLVWVQMGDGLSAFFGT